MMKRLPASFYRRADVLQIARELLGKILVTHFSEGVTAGRIVEIEAYNGIVDKASHAYGNRHTPRTSVMYRQGGIAYVYLCYGIHHLFNVVTNHEGVPHAILVRAIEPLKGTTLMLARMSKTKMDYTVGRGPGNVSKALGIGTAHTGASLLTKPIYVADDGYCIDPKTLRAGPRIGVDYAQEDALLPYRFYIAGNPFVSGTKNYRS